MAEHPRIILGLMTFGPNVEWGAKTTSIEEFGRFLDHFQQSGYHEVDTARSYQQGEQEAFTAAAHWRERGLKLATKLYPIKPGMHEPESLRSSIETSLQQLKTNSVDIFYLHAADRSVPFKKTLRMINELYLEEWLDPANHISGDVQRHQSIESELIPACRRYGLDIVTYNGLAGGLFTGKYKVGQTEAPTNTTQVDRTYRARFLRDATLDALSVIEPVVNAHKLTLIDAGMRWLIHHSALRMRSAGGNDGIVIGASSLTQLENNLSVIERGPLPKEVVDALDKGWQIAKGQAPEYWFGDMKYTYDTESELFGISSTDV